MFLKSLDDVIGEEKGMITLACEASKPRVSPTWRKEGKVLRAGPKYELLHTGKSLGLIIKDVTKEDAGEYSCDLGTEVSKAKVTVRGWYYCLRCTVVQFLPPYIWYCLALSPIYALCPKHRDWNWNYQMAEVS